MNVIFFACQDYKCHSFSSQLMILLSLPEMLFWPSEMTILRHNTNILILVLPRILVVPSSFENTGNVTLLQHGWSCLIRYNF